MKSRDMHGFAASLPWTLLSPGPFDLFMLRFRTELTSLITETLLHGDGRFATLSGQTLSRGWRQPEMWLSSFQSDRLQPAARDAAQQRISVERWGLVESPCSLQNAGGCTGCTGCTNHAQVTSSHIKSHYIMLNHIKSRSFHAITSPPPERKTCNLHFSRGAGGSNKCVVPPPRGSKTWFS